mgnify:FL=1
MTENNADHNGLEAYFDPARRTSVPLSEDMLHRLTQDALGTQKEFSATKLALISGPVSTRLGKFGQVVALIGGWPAMAGLATAGIAGLWIGAVPPAILENITANVVSSSDATEDDLYLVDPLPGYVLSLALGEGS